MTTRFPSKDPGETVTMEFDFTPFGGAPTSPDVTIGVHSGTDASPSDVLAGTNTISGSKVYRQATGGVNGVDYAVRCYATVGSERFLIDAILPVRASPRPA